jgi:hypothetical protein
LRIDGYECVPSRGWGFAHLAQVSDHDDDSACLNNSFVGLCQARQMEKNDTKNKFKKVCRALLDISLALGKM